MTTSTEDHCPSRVLVGTDVQSIQEVSDTIAEYGERYLRRLFTQHEIESCGGIDAPADVCAPGLTARFAAKEATIKLLRPGTVVPGWKDIELRRQPGGWCELRLSGVAAELAAREGLHGYSVSLAHGAGVGTATVVGLSHSGRLPHPKVR